MYCTNCGREIPDGSRRCPECGSAMRSKKREYRGSDADDSVRTLELVMMGASILCALFTLLLPLFTMSSFGYTVRVGFLTILGAVLQISSIAGEIGVLSGEDLFIGLFYGGCVVLVIVLCIIMAVKAWHGKGRIFFIVGNAVTIFYAGMVLLIASTLAGNLGVGINAGIGVWLTLLLSVTCLVISIIRMRRIPSGKSEAFVGRDTFERIKSRASSTFRKEEADAPYASGRAADRTFDRGAAPKEPVRRSHVERPRWEAVPRSTESYTGRPEASHAREDAGYVRPTGGSADAGYARTSGSRADAGYARATGGSADAGYARPTGGSADAGYARTADTREDAGYTRPRGYSSGTSASEPAAKIKYNMKNEIKKEESEFFHSDDELS